MTKSRYGSLQTKLSLFVFILVTITLIISAFSIDILLENIFDERARDEMENSYKVLKVRFSRVEDALLKQNLLTSTEISVINAVSLINNYQDVKNYQPNLFGESKKAIASRLLKDIIRSRSGYAAVYGKDGSLIAFAYQRAQSYFSGIVSYRKGQPQYLAKAEDSTDWVTTNLPEKIDSSLKIDIKLHSFEYGAGKIEYVSNQSDFSVESIRTIRRTYPDGTQKPVGILIISKPIDQFFLESESDLRTLISVRLLNNQLINYPNKVGITLDKLASSSQLFSSQSVSDPDMLRNEIYFIRAFVIPAINGKIYLLISFPKYDLQSALNQSRIILFLLFIVIAVIAISLSNYWLKRLISNPLHALVKQADRFEGESYPMFPVTNTSNEVGLLGDTLNKMVETLKMREHDLRLSEKQLKNAQAIAKVGHWTLNHEKSHLKWSAETFNILELDPGKITPTYETVINKVHPEDREMVNKAFIKSVESGGVSNITHRFLMDDGRVKYVHALFESVLDGDGNALFTDGIIQDITEQREKNEILRNTQKMDALGKLTGGIAHDFNNVLAIILVSSRLLEMKTKDDPELFKFADIISQAGIRGKTMTSKLLAFSKHKSILNPDNIDINALIQNQKHMLEKALTVSIKLKYDLENSIWPVWLDIADFEDAILNISINAMHAMSNSGTLSFTTSNITISTFDEASFNLPIGEYVLLSITDTGEGMNEETLSHIFDPFFTTKGDKGTGLGMSQVYGFVQRSKGTIKINSEVGIGTCISIYFPRNISEVNTSEIEKKKDKRNTDLPTRNNVILVVDDEKSLSQLTSELLSSNGYQVICAENGQEALSLLNTEKIDLMLSDVVMPGINGYELAQKATELYPGLLIIMMSGFSDDNHIGQDNNASRWQILQKPFDPDILLENIRELLDSKESD